MLSATVPNYKEFANWIGRTKKRKIYIEKTLNRPVPLEHYLYYEKTRVLVKDENNFYQDNYAKISKLAMSTAHGSKYYDVEKKKSIQSKRIQSIINQALNKKDKNNQSTIKPFITFLESQKLFPSIFFCFSRKNCENYFDSLAGCDLTSKIEKSKISHFLSQCNDLFQKRDLEIPQVKQLKAQLINGIAYHHAGLLPVVKEMVEILFSQGLIKVLFATTTFAIGVNMPARCVVFSSLKKCTDESNQLPSLLELKSVLQSLGDDISSKFRLTYKMIINLLSKETGDAIDLMKFSFQEHDIVKDYELNKKDIVKVQEQLSKCTLDKEKCQQYYDCITKIEELNSHMCEADSLKEGSIVSIFNTTIQNKHALIIVKNNKSCKAIIYDSIQSPQSQVMYHNVEPKDILEIKDTKPITIYKLNNNEEFYSSQAENLRVDMEALIANPKTKILKSKNYGKFKEQREELLKFVSNHPYNTTNSKEALQFARLNNRHSQIQAKLKQYESNINMQSYNNYKTRIQILQNMGYVDYNYRLTLKGRVSKEIGAQQTILLSELLFSGMLNELSPQELAAVLSFFSQEKSSTEYRQFNTHVDSARDKLLQIQKQISDYEKAAQIKDELSDWNDGFAELAFDWANGVDFVDICSYDTIHEGTIVRNIMKIDYLCKELKIASALMGNSQLSQVVDETQKQIRRDIIFMPSLYFT